MGHTGQTLPPGTLLGGKYELVRAIGQGSMGAVYEAMQYGIGRRVALKTVAAGAEKNARRLGREAEAAGALNHPNIVQVSDVHIDPSGVSYLVMELLEGRSLDAIMVHEELQVERVLKLMRQVLDALDTAHSANVVHRDLKPANLFVTKSAALGELVKVLDFGVAKLEDRRTQLTEAGNIVGTPLYMAPEQIRGSGRGPSMDLWSFGIVLYELLVGTTPFSAGSWQELLEVILKRDYAPLERVRPGLPAPLYSAVRSALQKDPARRAQSAGELDRLLAAAQTQLGFLESDDREGPFSANAPSDPPPARQTPVFGGVGAGGGSKQTERIGSLESLSNPPPPKESASPLDLREMLSTNEKDVLKNGPPEVGEAAPGPSPMHTTGYELPTPPRWILPAMAVAFVVVISVFAVLLFL